MSHKHEPVVAGLLNDCDINRVREAVCIQVEKVYDHCREKDCIENAPVYFRCKKIYHLVQRAINVKVRKAEVIDVYADTEPVPFKRGFYTVDVKFFIRVTLDIFVPGPRGTRIVTTRGLVVYDKKVILFGSEGNIKIFKSRFVEDGRDKPITSRLQQDNLPISKVEVAEPIGLSAKIEDLYDRILDEITVNEGTPGNITDLIPEEEDLSDYNDLLNEVLETETTRSERHHHHHHHHHYKRIVVSVGLFSIVKLVRYVQLLIPAFDFCYPNKECIAATEENPCDLFDNIDFPYDEFFPPQVFDFPGAVEAERRMRREERQEEREQC